MPCRSLACDGVEGTTYIIGAQTAMASRTLSLDFERTWRIVDFQTGGPTVSPLLLIYMCWKSNMISDRANHCRWDNNPPHESFVESNSRARMSYHNHPKSRLHSIT